MPLKTHYLRVGSLVVRLYLNFANDADYIQIGGVRLTLDHTP